MCKISMSNEHFLYIGNLAWKAIGETVATVFMAFTYRGQKFQQEASMLQTAFFPVQHRSFGDY